MRRTRSNIKNYLEQKLESRLPWSKNLSWIAKNVEASKYSNNIDHAIAILNENTHEEMFCYGMPLLMR